MFHIFLYCFPYHLLIRSLSLSLVLTDHLDNWPANSREPSISVPQHWLTDCVSPMSNLFMSAENWNTGLYVCLAGTLLTEPSLQPSVFSLLIGIIAQHPFLEFARGQCSPLTTVRWQICGWALTQECAVNICVFSWPWVPFILDPGPGMSFDHFQKTWVCFVHGKYMAVVYKLILE